MLQPGSIVEFDRKKQFKYIRPLGGGGTGDTHLFEDETTNMVFAFKKYAPKDLEHISELYFRFVDEIKILFNISHPNIVRVYNYYLYPELRLGYLQMEYVEGVSINKFEPDGWGKDWHDIFVEVVSAFEYLELNGILHRDIRPENILIDKNENVKVIDFGFGKKLEYPNQNGESVILNWPVSQLPEEILSEGIYNHQTEIYFVGKLFDYLLGGQLNDFRFSYVIKKMTEISSKTRYESFTDVSKAIAAGIISELDFSESEKRVYRVFADELVDHLYSFVDKYTPIENANIVINQLSNILRIHAVERFIQNNNILIKCFVSCGFNYRAQRDIEVECVKDFYELLLRLNPQKLKVVMDNIFNRLSNIPIKYDDDEIPF